MRCLLLASLALALGTSGACRQPNPRWMGPTGGDATSDSSSAPTTASAMTSAPGTGDADSGTGIGDASGTSADSGMGCPDGQQSCEGECVDVSSDDMHCGGCNAPCDNLYGCVDATCECTRELCNGECVNTQNNSMHCGECGNQCSQDRSECQQGACM